MVPAYVNKIKMKYSQVITSSFFLMMMKSLVIMKYWTKFIETANKIDDKVHARVPCDLCL